jgi:hypothetical protein
MPSSSRARPNLVGHCFPASCSATVQWGSLALEDAVAVAVEAERNAVSGDHGVRRAHIAEGVFGVELKMSGEDLAGGIVLKADEGE